MYRARRADIASASLAHRPGQPVPTIDYTDEEHGVWALVSAELAAKHERYAHPEYLEAKAALALPTDRVPQLHEVTQALMPLTGWCYTAAPGLVPLREFYADLGRRTFNSTQYLRHPSEPLYTPEPDIIHEVIGHANQLASPRFAAIAQADAPAALHWLDQARQMLRGAGAWPEVVQMSVATAAGPSTSATALAHFVSMTS